MRFADSKLKYLLLPLVPIAAIGLVELVDRTSPQPTTFDTTKSVDVQIKPVVTPVPPPPPAPCKGPCGSAPPA